MQRNAVYIYVIYCYCVNVANWDWYLYIRLYIIVMFHQCSQHYSLICTCNKIPISQGFGEIVISPWWPSLPNSLVMKCDLVSCDCTWNKIGQGFGEIVKSSPLLNQSPQFPCVMTFLLDWYYHRCMLTSVSFHFLCSPNVLLPQHLPQATQAAKWEHNIFVVLLYIKHAASIFLTK